MAIVTNPRGTDINTILATTRDNIDKSGKVNNAIIESCPTLNFLKSKGRMKTADGGYQIQVNLMYDRNSTFGYYDPYELLDNTPQNPVSSAFYSWAQGAFTVSLDGLSEFQNSGPHKIVNYVTELVQNGTMTAAEQQNIHLWKGDTTNLSGSDWDANGNKAIIPIPYLIAGVNTMDPGGIDTSANTWWDNQRLDFGATPNGSVFIAKVLNLYNTCSRKAGGPPDQIVFDQTSYENFIMTLHHKQRYTSTDRTMPGFNGVYFYNADIFWDYHVPDPEAGENYDNPPTAGAGYFINSKYLTLYTGKGKDWKSTPFRRAERQDAKQATWFWIGQLVASNRQKLGLLYGITKAMTTSS